jgi:hypothetical protein
MSFFGSDEAQLRERINSIADRQEAEIARREGIKARAQARMDRVKAEQEIATREAKLDRQSKLDPAYAAWGEHPPALKADESVGRYRRRTIADLQAHLPAGDRLSRVRFPDLRHESAEVLDRIEPDLLAAFSKARIDPATAPLEGERVIEEVDPHTGARATVFNRRHSFIHDLAQPCRQVIGGVGALCEFVNRTGGDRMK